MLRAMQYVYASLPQTEVSERQGITPTLSLRIGLKGGFTFLLASRHMSSLPLTEKTRFLV